MGRNSLKTIVVLAALAVLLLVPVVEANYMIGNPYVGTSQKMHVARTYSSGFYTAGMMPRLSRDRVINRYLIGNAAGRAWKPSFLSYPAEERTIYTGSPVVRSALRCLGCELGIYDMVSPTLRRGRYYYSSSKISERHNFVYTGDIGSMKSRLLTSRIPLTRRGALPILSASRSRLSLSPEDLAKLHSEMSSSGLVMQSGRRCLSCLYEGIGGRRGRYYSTSPDLAKAERVTPLY